MRPQIQQDIRGRVGQEEKKLISLINRGFYVKNSVDKWGISKGKMSYCVWFKIDSPVIDSYDDTECKDVIERFRGITLKFALLNAIKNITI